MMWVDTFWDTLDTVYVAGGELTVTVGATAQLLISPWWPMRYGSNRSCSLLPRSWCNSRRTRNPRRKRRHGERASSVAGPRRWAIWWLPSIRMMRRSGTVPATVTIPDGVGAVPFTLSVVDDAVVDGDQNVLITASAAGYAGGSDSLLVDDDEFPPVQIMDDGDAGFTETGSFQPRSWAGAYEGDNHYMAGGSDGEARWTIYRSNRW